MNKILLFLIAGVLININISAQSSITIDAGASISAEAGTDICADNKTTNGSLTGSGTWCEGALPVELEAFSADNKGRNVLLTWQTATEVNNYGFEIQKQICSRQNPEWIKIGFAKGSGNSNSFKSYTFTDMNAPAGLSRYRLKQIDNNGKYTYSYEVTTEVKGDPEEFVLLQNYPNPCNPKTLIKYQLPKSAFVTMKVFDILGNEVAILVNEQKDAGNYEIEFDASSLSSGIYIYTLKANEFSAVNKLIYLK